MSEVYWDRDEYAYVLKEKLSNGQTIFLMFQELDDTDLDYVNYNVVIGVYSKRKHANMNEENKRITGKSPWETAIKAVKMFDKIEQTVIQENLDYGKGVAIFVHWVDNRRRDAYYSVLSKRGYKYGMAFGEKHLIKRVRPHTRTPAK